MGVVEGGRARRWRPRWAVLVVLLALLSGCGIPVVVTGHRGPWSPYQALGATGGARTTDAGRTVAIRQYGGACDVPPRLRVQQTAARVRVLASTSSWTGPCTDLGVVRVLTVHLRAPLDGRPVVTGTGASARRLTVVDGALLLAASWLPGAYADPRPLGEPAPGGGWWADFTPAVEQAAVAAGRSCPGAPPELRVTQVPESATSRPIATHGSRTVDGVLALAQRTTGSGTDGWQLYWNLPGPERRLSAVTVQASAPTCAPGAVPSLPVVLRFARGLTRTA